METTNDLNRKNYIWIVVSLWVFLGDVELKAENIENQESKTAQLLSSFDSQIRDKIGICHINPFYNFTDKDYLNEGADEILRLGSRTIKLVIRDKMAGYYSFNHNWPAKFNSLIEAAESSYFKEVFSKAFNTYILMVFAPGREDIHYFTNGMTPEDIRHECESFYEFSKYLMTTYSGTGKRFIFQNWEGDWVLAPYPDEDKKATPTAIQGMIDWLNARQDGVEQARKELGGTGVEVYHAAELNRILRSMKGISSVANDVLPHTHCDLYSYSSYDIIGESPDIFQNALEYLRDKAPDSETFGADNIYLGEFGWPESYGGEEKRMRIIKEKLKISLDFGVQYVCIWDLYCDVVIKKYEDRPKNENMVGHWIIRADGTKTALWYYLEEIYQKNRIICQ